MNRGHPRQVAVAAAAAFAVGAVLSGSGAAAPSFPRVGLPTPPAAGKRSFDDKTLLVRFREGVSPAERADALAQHGARAPRDVHGTRFQLVQVDDAEQALARLKNDPRLAEVELNRIRHAFATPNDPLFATQQAYLATLRLPEAWDATQGSSSLKIAIVDTGVDLDHPDLANRIVPGYDFVNNDAVAQDDEGHGTLVAGVAAADTNNGIGVAGVAWSSSIMPVKVLDSTGSGNDFTIANGITWAADNGASVINLSLGGPGPSQTLYDAVQYAKQHGAVVVAAAGNDGAPVVNVPGSYADLAVGATDVGGDAAWFSTSGYWVDVSAPGIDILSTALAAGPAEAYATASGTSLASPLVAGIAALVRARNPTWTEAQVAAEVVRTVHDLGPRGLDRSYGVGLADAGAALGGAIQPPAAPPAGDGFEPNALRLRATPLTGTLSGTIAPQGDNDLLAIDVPAPKWFSVTVTPPPLSQSLRTRETDPSLQAYGTTGEPLVHSVDNSVGRPEAVLVPAATAGRYFVDVSDRASSLGSYTATLADAPPGVVFSGVDVAYSGRAYSVAIGDATGDGRNDLLSEVDDTLVVVPGQAGGYGTPVVYPTKSTSASVGLAIGDLNGDGVVDAAMATNTGPQVFLSSGGAYLAPIDLPQTSPTRAVEIADVTSDGRRDVVVDADDGTITVFHNDVGGTFTPVAVSTGTNWNISLGDLNGDGRTDILTCSSGALAVFAQNADGSFTRRATSDECGEDFVAADVTGDGRADIVRSSSGIEVFAQQPDGTLAATPDSYEGAGYAYANIAVGDLNGDGRNDVVANWHHWGWMKEYIQLPNGHLALGPEFEQYLYNDGPLAIGDANGDGRADVVKGQLYAGILVYRHAPTDAPPASEPANFYTEDTTPQDFSLDVPVSTQPTLDFDYEPDTRYSGTLVSGISGREIPTQRVVNSATLETTLRPVTGLAAGTPYLLAREPQFYNENGRISGAYQSWRFATAGTADTAPPETALVGDPSYFVTPTTASFTFTTSKVGSVFECSLDGGGFFACVSPRIYENVAPGTHTFSVRSIDVAGRVDSTPATRTWTVPAAPAVPYDAFTDAVAIRTGDGSFSLNTSSATKEPGEPNHAGNAGGHSLWMVWRAPRSGTMTLNTQGSQFDTLLAVYTGASVGSLTPVASNDDVSTSDTTSRLTFSAVGGTVYHIALDGKNGAAGSATFNYSATLTAPANDNFANAQTLSGTAGTLVASTVGATAEAGEPGSDVYPQPKSIWFTWTAPRSGLFSFDANGSAVQGYFDLYTGTSLSSLAPAGVRAQGDRIDQIYLQATAGVTYILRVDDPWTPAEWVVNWSDGGAAPPPPVDTTPPETTIDAGPTGTVTATDATFAFSSNESGSVFECRLDGGSFLPCASPKTYTGLAGGTHTFDVRATDQAGNTDPSPATRSWTIYVDTTPPETTITSGPPTSTSSQTATFAFTASETPVTFHCHLENEDFSPCTSPKTYTGLTGTHVFTVRAVDSAGNADASPATYTWTITNDMFAAAYSLGNISNRTTGNNGTATKEPGEPNHAGNRGGKSVWWYWTAPGAGTVTVDTQGSSFDTLLGVYTGTAVSALTTVAANDDYNRNTWSRVQFTASAGTVYRIAVDGRNGHYGSISLGVSFTAATPPDTTPPETTIDSGPSGTTTATDATFAFSSSEPGSTFQCRLDGASFALCGSPKSYSGLAAGTHTFDVRAIDVAGNTDPTPASRSWTISTVTAPPPDTTITSSPPSSTTSTSASFAFTSTVSPATFQCQLDGSAFAACASPTSYTGLAAGSHTFNVRAVDSTGNVDPTPATWTWTITSSSGPANDMFANAQTVSGTSGTVTGTNVGATKEAGEPNHAGNAGGHSLWYRFTPATSGGVTIDTFGSNFDTLLAAYTGSSVSALTAVAANDDTSGTQSQISFAAVGGTTYQIAVDGYGGATGSVTLHWSQSAGPANDMFANAIALTAASGSVTGTNTGATKETGEPNHAGVSGGHSIWYAWTAPTNVTASVDTFGSSFDTVLAVYTGTSVSALTAVASNDDSGGLQSKVTFVATAGVTYRIAVDGYGGATGSVKLTWG